MGEVKEIQQNDVRIIKIEKRDTLPSKYSIPPAAKRNVPLYEGLKNKHAERLVAVNKKNEVVGSAGFTQPGQGLVAAKKLYSTDERSQYSACYKRDPQVCKQYLLIETEKRLTPTKRINLGWIGSTQPGVGTKLINKLKTVGASRHVKVIDGFTRSKAVGFYKKQGATIHPIKIGRRKYYEFTIKTGRRR
jgi:hypothetical protein